MSVLETVKEAIGVGDDRPTYRCQECDETFQSESDPDSYWFNCPECDARDAERIDEGS